MNQEEKVYKAQKGDDNAFYELIQEKKEMLYKTAYTYVKNREDALDIVHDTVYKAYKSIKKLKEPKFFNTWLTRILINCSMDYIRKNKKTVELEVKMVSDARVEDSKQEEIMDLHTSMNKLSEKYKTIVILKYFQNLTLSEISEIMGVPIGTIKTNLHKALMELRIDMKVGEV